MNELRVFVASSSEQLPVANATASLLNSVHQPVGLAEPRLNAHVWQQGTFSFSSAFIESLEKELDRADFAVVIMTADDEGRVRRQRVNLPRDNVIFELGLFIGRLGRDRCFFFIDVTSKTRVPSDLLGVKPVKFVADSPEASGKHDEALSSCCRQIAEQMSISVSGTSHHVMHATGKTKRRGSRRMPPGGGGAFAIGTRNELA